MPEVAEVVPDTSLHPTIGVVIPGLGFSGNDVSVINRP